MVLGISGAASRCYCACICGHGAGQYSGVIYRQKLEAQGERMVWTYRRTDLIGDVEITCVWKLKGFGAPSPALGASSSDMPGAERKARDAPEGSDRPLS